MVMLKLASAIDAVNAKIGLVTAYLVYFMMAMIGFEVFMRTVFDNPTTWVHDMSSWTQVFYIFLGGAWALQKGYLVRVDVAYQSFPVRVQAFIDLFITSVLMALFAWVMITKGLDFGIRSFQTGEISANGTWNGPVWPAKLIIPIGMVLLTLAWTARAIRAAYRLIDPNSVGLEEEAEAAG